MHEFIDFLGVFASWREMAFKTPCSSGEFADMGSEFSDMYPVFSDKQSAASYSVFVTDAQILHHRLKY